MTLHNRLLRLEKVIDARGCPACRDHRRVDLTVSSGGIPLEP